MFPEKQPIRHADHHGQARNGHRVPALRQVLNVIGCALAIPLYYLTTAHSRYPVTLDIIITIAFTELNRYVIEGCRIAFFGQRRDDLETSDEIEEKAAIYLESQPEPPKLECLAAVVGWREDPALYARALESYKSSNACVFLLAGIDGDEAEDQDMARVFKKVCTLLDWSPTTLYMHTWQPLTAVVDLSRALGSHPNTGTVWRGGRASSNQVHCSKSPPF